MVETRKIQEVRGGTLTVSLPAEWAESVGIEQGDRIELYQHVDDVLAILPCADGSEPPDSIAVDVSELDPGAIADLTRTAYAGGYETMTFQRSEPFSSDHRRAFDSVVQLLAGATIANESETEVTIRVLLDSNELSICQLLRQLRFVAVSLYDDAAATLSGDGSSRDVTSDREQIDRLCSLIERVFQRTLLRLGEVDALGRTRPELFVLWTTAHELSHVSKQATRIRDAGRDVETIGQEVEFRPLARRARTVVEDAVSVVIDDSGVGAAREAITTSAQVRDRLATVDERLLQPADVDYRLAVVLDGVRQVAIHGGTIAERAVLATES